MKKIVFFAIIASGLVIFSCKKDKNTEPEPSPVVEDKGTLKVTFNGMAGNENLIYGDTYLNANLDSFTVNKFKYYVSNVVLTRTDNSTFTETNSYHLIDHQSNTLNFFTIQNIPAGDYKSITYMLGVDSTKNVSGAQDGDLSPSKAMFWDWNTGYIMLKFEGHSPQAGSIDKTVVFHSGGFSNGTSVNRIITIPFNVNISVSNTKSPHLKLKTDVKELFVNPATYNFADDYLQTSPGIRANGFANNYQDMTSFESIIQ